MGSTEPSPADRRRGKRAATVQELQLSADEALARQLQNEDLEMDSDLQFWQSPQSHMLMRRGRTHPPALPVLLPQSGFAPFRPPGPSRGRGGYYPHQPYAHYSHHPHVSFQSAYTMSRRGRRGYGRHYYDEEGGGEEMLEGGIGDSYEELLALDETIQKPGLDANALARFTVIQQLNEADVVRLEMCVICQDEYKVGDEIRRLPCLCCFHVDCVDRYFKDNTKCPICRVDVRGEN